MNHRVLLFSIVVTVGLVFAGMIHGHAHPKGNFRDAAKAECWPVEIAVQLSPNPTKDGTITFNNTQSESLHIYVFDSEGTLLHQIELGKKGKHTIRQLKRGVYPFDVFKDEVSVQRGNIFSN